MHIRNGVDGAVPRSSNKGHRMRTVLVCGPVALAMLLLANCGSSDNGGAVNSPTSACPTSPTSGGSGAAASGANPAGAGANGVTSTTAPVASASQNGSSAQGANPSGVGANGV